MMGAKDDVGATTCSTVIARLLSHEIARLKGEIL